MMNGAHGPELTDPSKMQVDFQKVQKRIEAEIGAYVFQHCIKDIVIEQLTAELNQLKLEKFDPSIRPVPGHNKEKFDG